MGAPAVFLCFGLFMWIHVQAESWDSCMNKPQTRCGDNLCKCCLANDPAEEPGVAICEHGVKTYIPRMPDSVRYLMFMRSDLTAVALTEQFFFNVTQVTHLRFWLSRFGYIRPDAFSGFKNLVNLGMNSNTGLTMDTILNMLSIPGLLQLQAVFCDLPVPQPNAFSNIKSDVVALALTTQSSSREYDMTPFCSLPELRVLAVGLGLANEAKTTCNLQIEHLDLSSNSLDSLPPTCTHQAGSFFPNLKILNMARNNLLFLEKNACLPELIALDLNQNSFRGFFNDSLNIVQFPKLKNLSLSGARPLIGNSAFESPTLQRLVLDWCDTDFGDRTEVCSDAFAGCPRLTELSLLHNVFDNVDDARFLELFGSLNLTVLQLSYNDLSSISLNTFVHFHNLRRLDLVKTGLSGIPDGVFSSLTHLDWLDVSDNKIATVTERTFSQETRQHLQVLRLSKNPFTCSCDLMWFRNWFVSRPRLFVYKEAPSSTCWKSHGYIVGPDSETNDTVFSRSFFPLELIYSCSNLPGTSLTDFMMADQACVLSQSVSVAIILVTSAMIVMLSTVSLVFRFRWHIRLVLYEVFRGRGDVRRMRLHTIRFDYDVFVSYTSEDLPWVQEHLMPELEDRLGLRLCVHERDFIPGHNIVDNIVECVQSSKKILMVFSKDFVHSQWCQFELTFCLTHVMDYDDTLLIVCVDDVTSRAMTPAMMAVMKTTTYIQWGDHGDAEVSFWGRLRLALHEVTDMAVVVEAIDRDLAVDIAEAAV